MFVADALSRKERLKLMMESEDLIKEFERFELDVCTPEVVKEKLYMITFQPELFEKIRKYQEEAINGDKDKMTNVERLSQKDDKGILRNFKELQ